MTRISICLRQWAPRRCQLGCGRRTVRTGPGTFCRSGGLCTVCQVASAARNRFGCPLAPWVYSCVQGSSATSGITVFRATFVSCRISAPACVLEPPVASMCSTDQSRALQWFEVLRGCGFAGRQQRLEAVARLLVANGFDDVRQLQHADHPSEWLGAELLEV